MHFASGPQPHYLECHASLLFFVLSFLHSMKNSLFASVCVNAVGSHPRPTASHHETRGQRGMQILCGKKKEKGIFSLNI